MIAPLTEKFQILIYGKDIRLLETRKLLLANSGFRVHTVSSLEQFRSLADGKQSPYELFILCHTIPEGERIKYERWLLTEE
jgi:DNA-binding response OmpR family regulator